MNKLNIGQSLIDRQNNLWVVDGCFDNEYGISSYKLGTSWIVTDDDISKHYRSVPSRLTIITSNEDVDQFGITFFPGNFWWEKSPYPLLKLSLFNNNADKNVLKVIFNGKFNIVTGYPDYTVRHYENCTIVYTNTTDPSITTYSIRIPWEEGIYIRPSTEWLV